MAAWSFLEQRKTSRSTLFQMTLATVLMVPVLGDCGPPPSLPFASPINQLYKTIFPTGTVLKYTCFHGFKKVNTSRLTCDVNGLWMYSNFCVKKRCRNPGELVNGRVEIMTDIFLGSTIEFSCSNGFLLIGSTTSRCVVHGKGVDWSDSLPECVIVTCEPPPEISNGKHSGRTEDIYTYGSSVTYNCDPGFTLLGNDSLTCTVVNKTIGVWSPSPPTCGNDHQLTEQNVTLPVSNLLRPMSLSDMLQSDHLPSSDAFFGASLEINCHQPQIPKGHLVSGFQQSYYYRDSVEIRCKKGYVLRGSSLIYCESNGEWYPSVPTCEPSGCIGSPEIPHALWEGNKLPLRDFEIFEIGTHLKYQCKPGYRPVLNEAQFVTCQENLSWSPSKGCEKICCPIPYMENIRIVSERRDFSGVCIYAYRDYIFYICNEDTYPVPIDRRSLCEADGKWYPEIPSCHAAESSKDIFARGMCSKPVIMHGILSVEKDHYIETENVTIHCDTGYYLVGSSTIFCSENKTWLPEIPNCKVMSVLTQGTSVMSPLHLEGLDHCRLVNEGRKLLECLSSPEDVRRALQVYKLSLEIKILEQETEKWARAYKKTFEHLKMKRLFRPFG